MAKKKTGFRPEDSKKGDVVRFRYRGNECIMQCGGKSNQLVWPCAFAVGLWLTEEDRANGNPLNFYTDIDLPVSVAQCCTGLRRANLQEQRNLNAAINKWRDENTDTSKRGIPKGLTEAELDAMIAATSNSKNIPIRMDAHGVSEYCSAEDLDAEGYLTYENVSEELLDLAMQHGSTDERVMFVGNRPTTLTPYNPAQRAQFGKYVVFDFLDRNTGYINTCVGEFELDDEYSDCEHAVGVWGPNDAGIPNYMWRGFEFDNYKTQVFNVRSASAADVARYKTALKAEDEKNRERENQFDRSEACREIEYYFNAGGCDINFFLRPNDEEETAKHVAQSYFPCGYQDMEQYLDDNGGAPVSNQMIGHIKYIDVIAKDDIDAHHTVSMMYMTCCEAKRIILDAIRTGKRIRNISIAPYYLDRAVHFDDRAEAKDNDKVHIRMSYAVNSTISQYGDKKGTAATPGKFSVEVMHEVDIPYRSLTAFCDDMLDLYAAAMTSALMVKYIQKDMPTRSKAERELVKLKTDYERMLGIAFFDIDSAVDQFDNSSKANVNNVRKLGLPTKPFIKDGELFSFNVDGDEGMAIMMNLCGYLGYYYAFNINGDGNAEFGDVSQFGSTAPVSERIGTCLPRGIQFRTPNIMERTYFDIMLPPAEREKVVAETREKMFHKYTQYRDTSLQTQKAIIDERQKLIDEFDRHVDNVNNYTSVVNDILENTYKQYEDKDYVHAFATDPFAPIDIPVKIVEPGELPKEAVDSLLGKTDAPSDYIDTTVGYAESDYMQSDFHDRTVPDMYDNDSEATVPDGSPSADTPAYSAAAAILPAVDGGDYREETAKEAIVNIEATLPILPYLRGQRLPQDFSFPVVSEQPLHNSKGRDISETKVVSGLLGAMNTIVHARETYDNIYYLTSDYHSEVVARCMQQRLVKAPSLLDLCPDGEAISGLIILPKDHNGGYNHFLYVVDRREAVWRIEVANFYDNRLINYYHGYRSNRLGVDSNCRYYTFADPAYDDTDPITNATKISNEMMAFVTTFVEMEQDADNIVRAAIEGSDDAVEVQAETIPEDVAKKYTATSDIILRDYAFYHYIFELKQIAVRGHLKHYLVGSRADGTLHRELRLVRAHTRKSRVKR